MDLLEAAPLLADPGRLLAGKKAASRDVLRCPGRSPGGRPVAPGDRRLGAVQPLCRGVDVDPGVAGEDDSDAAPALELDQAPELREQRRKAAAVASARPDRLDELVSARGSQPVDHEEGEEETPLPSGQLVLDPPSRDLADEPSAELDACRRQAFAKVTARRTSDNACRPRWTKERPWRS